MTEQSHSNPRPRILLTNDDGISSDALWATYQALKRIGDVLVCAPSTQQSAVGRSLSVFKPVRVHKVMMHDVVAYSVEGSPTDSVIIGLFALKWKPDLVVSGTNIGENLSCEAVTTSGTIGAALEAANHDVPAIAFSLQVLDQGAKFAPKQQEMKFDALMMVVEDVVRRVVVQGFPSGVGVLNVNIPHTITGTYEVTTLAHKLFQTDVDMRHDPRGRPYFWLTGALIKEAPKGTDLYAVNNGNISITPLTIDCTAKGRDEVISELFS